jgi:cytoskeleton protein RodZ
VPTADVNSGLKLIFAQPSWVEIRDRSGQIIFSQLNPAGSERDIEGQPPFALVVGNASNVTVKYKGQVVELSQRSKDDVARLNLD